MTAPVALALREIRVCFGPTPAVDGLSLQVHRGEIVALLGPNGSGKSTTLAVAAGLLDPAAGSASIDGIARDADPVEYARRVGLVPQEPALYEDLGAEANLHFVAGLYGLAGAQADRRVHAALEFAGLTHRRQRVATFSGGMKQRLNLACALLHDPVVLLLDEPTAGLDPASRETLFATLHELREAGRAILMTTHQLDEAERGCDRLAVLDRGRLVACGTPAALARPQPGGRAILYAHLRDLLPTFFLKSLQHRVGPGVEVEVTGRRLRLAADTQEELGKALAVVLADGVVLDTFRTPPGRLEHLLRGTPAREPAAELAPVPFPPPGME